MGSILEEAEKIYKEMTTELKKEAITAMLKDIGDLVTGCGGALIAGFSIPDGEYMRGAVMGKGQTLDQIHILSKLAERVYGSVVCVEEKHDPLGASRTGDLGG